MAVSGAPTVVADENYIKESIRQPQAKIRAGYQGINMSAYPPSIVKDAEIDALIAFIKDLDPASVRWFPDRPVKGRSG